MTQDQFRDKARVLLSRRNATGGMGYYLRQTAGRHVLFSLMFFALIAAAWFAEVPALAYVVGGVWAGRLTRDLQWYQRLAAEWQVSREFVDWPKVERVASSG